MWNATTPQHSPRFRRLEWIGRIKRSGGSVFVLDCCLRMTSQPPWIRHMEPVLELLVTVSDG
jgi:hypothetical protein